MATMRSIVADTMRLVREDAARWIRPEQVAPVEEVTPKRLLVLLARNPSLRATTWYRIAHASHRLGVRGLPTILQQRLLTRFGLEIAPATVIGGGLYIAHPVGCVLVADPIGRNLTVVGAATFGARAGAQWPTIGDDVFVGIGARVLGGIHVGNGARIGANAVVLRDVEPDTTVVGAPATPVRRSAGA